MLCTIKYILLYCNILRSLIITYNFLYIIKAGERNKLILYFFNACQTYLINVILIINTRHKQVYTPVLLVNETKSAFLKFHFSLNLKKISIFGKLFWRRPPPLVVGTSPSILNVVLLCIRKRKSQFRSRKSIKKTKKKNSECWRLGGQLNYLSVTFKFKI